jgi:hypothetical protein
MGGVKLQNGHPVTEKEISFKRIELIGDKAVDCILTHYYIDKGWGRRKVVRFVNEAVSNEILGIAGKDADLRAPDIIKTKYYGSAFEYEVGRLLTEEGYQAAFDYVRTWLVPVLTQKINVKDL